MKTGYIRVSSADQNSARQHERLQSYHLEKVFVDYASGKDLNRPEFRKLMDFLREGDELFVCSMDRLARNLNDLLKTITDLQERGVKVTFLKEKIELDPSGKTSPMTKLLIAMVGAVAEFERALIKERQKEGIALAQKKGLYKGRKPLDQAVIDKAIQQIKEGIPVARVAKELKISRSTIYRRMEKNSWNVSE